MPLSKEEILAADDLETREVEVPEWGGTVLVKALSGSERAKYLMSITALRGRDAVPNLANISAKLCARAIVGEDGRRLFGDNEINALGAKSGAALERVFAVAAEISGLQDEDIQAAIENFDETASEDSTSDSPETSD